MLLGMLLSAALLGCLRLVAAQDCPNTTTPCDFYTEKTVGNNTADNERILRALVLHSALLGPFSTYNTVPVPDFTDALVPTTFLGEAVDLNGYFNGAQASANRGGSAGVAFNFLDDSGLKATRELLPGYSNTSAQYTFFSHVYSYFGTFLGCSYIGTPALPAYAGKASMYEVHKFMDLNAAEMGFFIDQAVRGLLSIGFSDADAQYVNATLVAIFNYRCAPAAAVVPADAGPQLQSICIAADCLLAANDTCAAYETAVPPVVANATLLGNYTKEANGSTLFASEGDSASVSGSTTAGASAGASATANATSEAGRAWPMGSGLWEQAVTVVGAAVVAFMLS